MIRATIVIPTAGRPTQLETTLASLHCPQFPKEQIRTLVIENGPTKQCEQIAKHYASALNLDYYYKPLQNKSRALNFGISLVKDELVIFFDDDIEVYPTTLKGYLTAAQQYGRGHFFGGPSRSIFKTPLPEHLSPLFPPSVMGHDLGNVDKETPSLLLGFNWAAFSNDLREVGMFHPDFGPGAFTQATGQETDMQNRLRKQDVRGIYLAACEVGHHVAASSCTLKWIANRRFRTGVEYSLSVRHPLEPSDIVRLGAKALLSASAYLVYSAFNLKRLAASHACLSLFYLGKLRGKWLVRMGFPRQSWSGLMSSFP